MTSRQVLKFVLSMLHPFRWWLAGQAFVALIWAATASLGPYIIKLMLDRIATLSMSDAWDALLGFALALIALEFVINMTFRFYEYAWLNLNPPLKRHSGSILMSYMVKHSHQLYQDHFAGGLASRIKEVMSSLPDLISIVIDRFLAVLLTVVIAMYTLWSVSTSFAFALAVWTFFFIAVSIAFARSGERICVAAAEQKSYVVGIIVDILSNMMTVRLFSGRRRESAHLHHSLTDYMQADQRRDWFFLKMSVILGTSFVLYQAACLYFLIDGFSHGTVTGGDFALILSINIAVVDRLWELSHNFAKATEYWGNIRQGISIALSPLEIDDAPQAPMLEVTHGRIVFEKVGFHYKGTQPLFQDTSVVIEAGQKVGLVGYSGSGKSTFVNLILRLFDVSSGRILIDDQDVCLVTQESLRNAIGMIPQDPSLFHRTLAENISYGHEDATQDDVIQAAERAHAHHFIARLPEGYNSLVGERGVKLSGGQRQRIAIARGFLKNAPILILDEATSQLDSVTEVDIQDSLWELMQGKTTLVIAHRLSTLLHMDRILVFDKGQIVEDGTHEELIKKGGLYKTLWETQVGGFLPDKRA